MKTFYFIGVPGSGKSTFMRVVLEQVYGVQWHEQIERPVPHLRYGAGAVTTAVMQIGRQRDTFSGTDALAMNINPRACEWVRLLADTPGHLLGEGDRLANNRFLDACPRLTLIYLELPLAEARRRSEARARSLGVAPQGESWWKGRATKTANLVAQRGHITIDAMLHPDQMVDDYRVLLRAAAA